MRKLSCTLLGSDTPVDYLENYIAQVPYLEFNREAEWHRTISDSMPVPKTDLLFCEPANFSVLNQQFPLMEFAGVVVCIVPGKADDYQQLGENIFSIEQHPLTFDRFLNLIERARLFIEYQKISDTRKTSDFVFVKSEYKMIRVNFSDILFCEGLKDYTQIYIEGKTQPILTLQNLKSFTTKLPADKFIRVHRSFVVALNHIDIVGRNELIIGKRNIPIGNSFREDFFAMIEQYS